MRKHGSFSSTRILSATSLSDNSPKNPLITITNEDIVIFSKQNENKHDKWIG
jgi:hypothetical protein